MGCTHTPQCLALELLGGSFLYRPTSPYAIFSANMEPFENPSLPYNAKVSSDLLPLHSGSPRYPNDIYGCPWQTSGLMYFDQIVCPITLRLRSFADLQKHYSLPSTSFYGYLQIRHIASSLTRDLVFDRPTVFQRICKTGPLTKGLISQIYKLLVSLPNYSFLKHSYMLKWEGILGHELFLQI